MNRLFLLAGALLSLVFAAAPASAATLLYTVTGPNGFSASFQLDDHPISNPTPGADESYLFYQVDTPGTYSDGSLLAGLTFYDASADGGMTIYTVGNTLVNFTGMALYTGTNAAPVLFAFGPTVFQNFDGPGTFIVSAAAVPEPAAWAMLVLGFGVVGAGIRRRQVARVTFA
ncbi:MAG: PEPxxWA-CTERM sorting domain-containing protein [Sphingomonas sp.]